MPKWIAKYESEGEARLAMAVPELVSALDDIASDIRDRLDNGSPSESEVEFLEHLRGLVPAVIYKE